MKKLSIVVAMLLCALFVFSGCTTGAQVSPSTETSAAVSESASASVEASTETSTAPEQTYRMALVVKNLTNPYFVTLADGAKAKAEELGVDLDVQATNADTEIDQQIQILDTLLTQNLDAILVIPLNGTAVVPWVLRANEAGVPVINVDTAINADEMTKQGASVVCKITTDNISAGEEAAHAIITALNGTGKVAVLEGTAGAATAEDRKTGFNNVMSSEGTGIEIVASQEAKYNRNEAYTVTTSILAANPDLNAIFAANDEMALGAIAAIDEAGLTGKITVVGVNFSAEMQEAMKAGKALGSVNQDPAWLGAQGIQVAVDYINGKTVEPSYTSESKMMYVDDVQG